MAFTHPCLTYTVHKQVTETHIILIFIWSSCKKFKAIYESAGESYDIWLMFMFVFKEVEIFQAMFGGRL